MRAPISQRLRLMVVGGVSSHLMYLNCAALVLFTDIHVDDDAGSRKIISLPAYVRNLCVARSLALLRRTTKIDDALYHCTGAPPP